MPVERKDKRKVFFYKDLSTCTHVLLLTKHDVKVALERPYTGPCKVLERVSDRVYKIKIVYKVYKVRLMVNQIVFRLIV